MLQYDRFIANIVSFTLYKKSMTKLRVTAAVAVLCLLQGAGARSATTAPGAPLLALLPSELQRHKKELRPTPVHASLAAYTVLDERSTQILASFGAIERSDESHQRFATVEMRVGDYFLDNTHPIRGDARAIGPRLAQVELPLTDDEKPVRQALWRATDRTYFIAGDEAIPVIMCRLQGIHLHPRTVRLRGRRDDFTALQDAPEPLIGRKLPA